MVHSVNSNGPTLPNESLDIRSCTERRDAILAEIRENKEIIDKKIDAISFVFGITPPSNTSSSSAAESTKTLVEKK